jgi:hypothetical protein
MGHIGTETGAIRRSGFLNCFSSPDGRFFVVAPVPLSQNGSRLRGGVGYALMLKRKLELVTGDSFRAAYRLKAMVARTTLAQRQTRQPASLSSRLRVRRM